MPKEINSKNKTNSNIIDKIIESQKKKWGGNIFLTPEDTEQIEKRIASKNIISTESLSFNKMTGIGGIPRGRIYLVYGKRGIGKTTTLLSLYKSAQKDDFMLIFVDIEHRLDVGLLDNMNIDRFDKNKFLLMLPNTDIEIYDTLMKLTHTGKKLFIVFDSISALNVFVQSKKAEKTYGDGKRPGQVAASISEFLKEITPPLSKSESMLFLISQERMKNIVGYAYKGATGGLAPEFYATYILNIKQSQKGEIIKNGQQVGSELIMEFVKTTTSLPPQPRKIALKYGYGFYLEYEIVKLGIQEKFIEESGNWYSYKNIKKQGLMNMVELFEKDKKLFKELRKELNV